MAEGNTIAERLNANAPSDLMDVDILKSGIENGDSCNSTASTSNGTMDDGQFKTPSMPLKYVLFVCL